METKLILVDGISGSGKSTTAQYLAIQFKRNGKKARWYHEEESANPLYCEDNESIHDLKRLQQFIETTLAQWRSFVQIAVAADTTFIIESYIFQDTVRMLFQNNLPEEEIRRFTNQVLEITTPLNPVLIYLRKASVEASLRETWAVRGAQWKEWSVNLDAATPFAVTRQLQGEEAAIAYWSAYQELTDQLFDTFDLPKLVIDTSTAHWNHYRLQMLDFLGLSHIPAPTPVSLKKFCGYYEGIDPEKDFSCTITLEGGELICQDFFESKVRMLPQDENSFYLEAHPVEFHFSEDVGQIILDGTEAIRGVELLRF